MIMKKILTLATAALLTSGLAFAHEGDKNCEKGKDCCKKKGLKTKNECCKKPAAVTNAKTASVKAVKKA